ncbi:MAG: hypothetical protein IJS03_08580 [Eubacterium sp.]|nr:hypothetical protein [Eubacterium sp.]
MKPKFIRIISPFTFAAALLFDASAAYFTCLAVEKVSGEKGVNSFLFLGIMLFLDVVAVLTTRETLKNGVRFSEHSATFTALDDNNTVEYDKIESVQVQKDTKASFTKNFISRYSVIVFYLKDNTVHTIELGHTTKNCLQKIEGEFNDRIN